jgi:hypothetical protein
MSNQCNLPRGGRKLQKLRECESASLMDPNPGRKPPNQAFLIPKALDQSINLHSHASESLELRGSASASAGARFPCRTNVLAPTSAIPARSAPLVRNCRRPRSLLQNDLGLSPESTWSERHAIRYRLARSTRKREEEERDAFVRSILLAVPAKGLSPSSGRANNVGG